MKVIVGLREYGIKTLRSDMVKATREQKANVKSDAWKSCRES